MADSIVTDKDVEEFEKNGVVVIRNALSDEWVKFLQKAVARLMEEPTKMGLEYAYKEGSTRFFGDQYMWLTKQDFKKVAFESPMAEIAGKLMGSNKINLFFDQVLVKEPGAQEPTPWHHDLPYWMVDGEQISTVWIALDPISFDNGGMEYVKGSHRHGKLYVPTFFGDSVNDDTFDANKYEKLPDVKATFAHDDFISFSLKPGDAAIHHALTLHGAPGNRSSKIRRRGYMLRVIGDNVVYAPQAGQAKVAVQPDLPAGALMGGKYFPQIWQRPAF